MSETATKKAAATRKRKVVPDTQKQAMAEGRRQAQAVRSYLEALRTSRAPKRRGRKRTPESINNRLEAIRIELAEDDIDVLRSLKLTQEQTDLIKELRGLMNQNTVEPGDYEADFVKVAKAYGERQGISPETWKELGVPRPVLKKARII